jgi:hypothetical protein
VIPVLRAAEEMRISLRRLKNLLFGKKTEKSCRDRPEHPPGDDEDLSLQDLPRDPNRILPFLVPPAVECGTVLRRVAPRAMAGWGLQPGFSLPGRGGHPLLSS